MDKGQKDFMGKAKIAGMTVEEQNAAMEDEIYRDEQRAKRAKIAKKAKLKKIRDAGKTKSAFSKGGM